MDSPPKGFFAQEILPRAFEILARGSNGLKRGLGRRGREHQLADSAENGRALRQIYVDQAFTTPADQNYLIARIAFNRGLILDGYWSAAQATEKYLKAALLLNGFNALPAHQLVGLFDELKSNVPLALIPDEFSRLQDSDHTSISEWGNNAIRDFVGHLEIYRSPDNRYGRNGYHFDFYVLPKLDQLIYFVRRNCRTLNPQNPGHKDLANWKLSGAILERHTEKRKGGTKQHHQWVDDFLTGNAIWNSVISGGAVEVGLQPVMAWQQAAYPAAIQNVKATRQELIEFNKWLLSHVKFNKQDKASIQEEITRLEKEG